MQFFVANVCTVDLIARDDAPIFFAVTSGPELTTCGIARVLPV